MLFMTYDIGGIGLRKIDACFLRSYRFLCATMLQKIDM